MNNNQGFGLSCSYPAECSQFVGCFPGLSQFASEYFRPYGNQPDFIYSKTDQFHSRTDNISIIALILRNEGFRIKSICF